MIPDDLHRELTKARSALYWAGRHLTAQNEANAALHCAERVLYQPVTVAVENAKAGLDRILADREAGAAYAAEVERPPVPVEVLHAQQLAAVLADLDRCEHGRHEGDTCGGCYGPSHGNPHAPTGRTLGYGLRGDHVVMPPAGQRHDPRAWRQSAGDLTSDCP